MEKSGKSRAETLTASVNHKVRRIDDFTAEEKSIIRARRKWKFGNVEIARQFNCDPRTIAAIAKANP